MWSIAKVRTISSWYDRSTHTQHIFCSFVGRYQSSDVSPFTPVDIEALRIRISPVIQKNLTGHDVRGEEYGRSYHTTSILFMYLNGGSY